MWKKCADSRSSYSMTASTSVFVVLLLSVSVVQGQNGWGVTYTSTEICAAKGSTVNIHCTYRYPSNSQVKQEFWFTKMNGDEPEALKTRGRVQNRCSKKSCTLTIKNVIQSDSGLYKFRFTTNLPSGKYTGKPGVTLSVTDPQLQVRVSKLFSTRTQLECFSNCLLPERSSYVWFKNGLKQYKQTSTFYSVSKSSADSYFCALSGREEFCSPSVYAPRIVSVLPSPSGEIVEGTSVQLACNSDANPPAMYAWYKNHTLLTKEKQLVLSSIKSSESGEYYCVSENELGRRTSTYISVDVKHAPKKASVSVIPSGDIGEGSSVNLTCTSDANPAANYTWYKDNQTLPQKSQRIYFTGISCGDTGNYKCKSENQYGNINSSCVFLDVQYPPKVPSVSVSTSGEIVEGSSVTLTCSTDANPAANYTWYKENEEAPKASGHIFIITEIRPEHSGNYYCEAVNQRGHHNSTLNLSVLRGSRQSTAVGLVSAVILVIILISAFLLLRKIFFKKTHVPGETPAKNAQLNVSREHVTPSAVVQREPAQQQKDIFYASISFSKIQEDPLYSNIMSAQPNRHNSEDEYEDVVEYTMVSGNGTSGIPR